MDIFDSSKSSKTSQKYLSNQVFVSMGSEWHEKWEVNNNINGMNNQKIGCFSVGE